MFVLSMLTYVIQETTIQAQNTNINNTSSTESNTDTNWLTPLVIAAFITAISSIILAGIKFFLDIRKSEHNARRVYEYEARKRLYNEFEPLSFQLMELSEIAMRRIRGLAREARKGHLEKERNWYSDVNSYHMINSIYRLLAPLAVFRLMQRRLTFTDIVLDKSVKSRYRLAKVLYYSFTHDMRLAESDPQIPDYEPMKDLKEGIRKRPDEYNAQGIYYQSLVDTMVDALITKQPGNTLRIISFKEFEINYKRDIEHRPFDIIILLLEGFHPKTKPVLWRILILQLHIYRALIALHTKEIKDISSNSMIPEKIFSVTVTKKRGTDIDWRTPSELKLADKNIEFADKKVWYEPLHAVENYLRINWPDLFEK